MQNVRPAVLPFEMAGNMHNMTRDGKAFQVVLSDEGVLARRIAMASTDFIFNPMDFAIGVIDGNRKIEWR